MISVSCSMLQIVGLILIGSSYYLPRGVWVVIAICGLAGIVNWLIPKKLDDTLKNLGRLAALAGLGIVIISILNLLN